MKNFIIKTMGCKSNQFETSIIIENLVSNGFFEVKNFKDADYFILNSCSVTHKSDNEAMYILRNAKHENPNIKNILTGCIAQIEKEKLLEFPYIDSVVGNDEKLHIATFLDEKFAMSDIMIRKDFSKFSLSDTTKTRASVKIQDGCDNRCSYCIIPFARGKSRSADENFIINQIKTFENDGFKEVVLTGIHIGQWGLEFDKNLLDLLKTIEKNTSIRYRLGSLNPLEINDEMLDFLAKSELFCPHFHLSLQSACDNTLHRMNRFYKTKDFIELIEKITDKFDKPFIGSDIIAGFVGETEDDFNTTIENIRLSKLTKIHTFPYSIRKGTVAETMNGHLDNKTKNFRATVIKSISVLKHLDFLKKNINSIHNVLIEKHFDKKGMLKGVSENYINVHIDCHDKKYLNTMQKVLITDINNNTVYGKIL